MLGEQRLPLRTQISSAKLNLWIKYLKPLKTLRILGGGVLNVLNVLNPQSFKLKKTLLHTRSD
jgi:hypothetical protein